MSEQKFTKTDGEIIDILSNENTNTLTEKPLKCLPPIILGEKVINNEAIVIPTFTRTNLTTPQIKELTSRIKAMSPEELELVSNTIPVELCLKRIKNEIDRATKFEETIRSVVNKL